MNRPHGVGVAWREGIDWPSLSANRQVAETSVGCADSDFGIRISFHLRQAYGGQVGFRYSGFGFLVAVIGLLPLLLAVTVLAQPTSTPGDNWLAQPGVYARVPGVVSSNQFSGLWAEAVAGKLKVTWASTNAPTNTSARLFFSVDEPGHWPAREWRSLAMIPRGASWDVPIPVVQVDVPVIYFVAASVPGEATNLSSLRICVPRGAGLEAPSRAFWPFLEGFEEGLDQWQLMEPRPDSLPLATNAVAVNGYASLKVAISTGHRSVSVGTTVLRSWHLTQFNARGLQLWARTKAGMGEFSIAAMAQAFTPKQAAFPCPARFKLGPDWKKLEVSLDFIPEARRAEVDFLTLQFEAAGPAELWLDDLSLLGRWKLELE